MHKSVLLIKVEIGAGTSVESAAFDMFHLSKKLGVGLTSEHNGVKIDVLPNDTTPQDVIRRYKRYLEISYGAYDF